MPPDEMESSRLPRSKDVANIFMGCICCAGFLVFVLFLMLFIGICALLAWNNTTNVKKLCPGFWEFSLVSLLSPIIIPSVYCVYGCCCLFCFGWWNWYLYSGTCMMVMAIAGLHMSITVSENGACIDALKQGTPSSPVPWLLYAGWLKCILFFSGAFSSLYCYFNSLQAKAFPKDVERECRNDSSLEMIPFVLKNAFGFKPWFERAHTGLNC